MAPTQCALSSQGSLMSPSLCRRNSSGPVMRMVIGLDEGVVVGQNIIPGGQSAIVESDHFADQARLWLANETLPMRFTFSSVLASASGRESYLPR